MQPGPVQCSTVQEALSARLDGEHEPVPAKRVDEHVSTCAECANWWQQAFSQAAALRLESIQVAPMFHVELPKRRQTWQSRLAEWLRAGRPQKPGTVELRAPEGSRFGRRMNHLRAVKEPPA